MNSNNETNSTMTENLKPSNMHRDASHIRNICILAHVDHGKTTLADALVASNGIISARLAGQLRYMDSRPDEQERGITMKSSAVSLSYKCPTEEQADGNDAQETFQSYLINLIDSPGHVDFSSEVSTAVRLCDGGVVVVDVVEGVQPQTKVVLQQAWAEGIKPVLVLNKIDRLIVETKLSPLDAFYKLSQVLEDVNAVIAELFTSEFMEEKSKITVKMTEERENVPISVDEEYFDWATGLEDADDSDLYFSPDRGNVIFASAIDGWAFGLSDFAKIFSKKLGFNERVLNKTLWGDYFINLKAKKIMKWALAKGKKPLFVQMILDNIWAVYDCVVNKDKEQLEKIVQKLGVDVPSRDLRSTDSRVQLSAVFSKWLPLTQALLKMVCKKIPPPNELSEDRIKKLMVSSTVQSFDTLHPETQKLKMDFLNCKSLNAPVIAFVSKMFPVERKHLPENKPKPITREEMARKREAARKNHADKMQKSDNSKESEESATFISLDLDEDAKSKAQTTGNAISSDVGTSKEENLNELESKKNKGDENETTFVAFARVFSGTLKPGQKMYVLGPKYDPDITLQRIKEGKDIMDPTVKSVHDAGKTSKQYFHIMEATIGNLYLLLGRDLESIDVAPAGSIIGIGGLSNYILKSATLSSDLACPAFVETTKSGLPILRVAIESELSTDMPRLILGLNLLNQADANVQVFMTDKGEHVLVTAGEVHLERCVRDLKETYAKGIKVNVSAPLVPFRETIIDPPEIDMVNEQLNNDNKIVSSKEEKGQDEVKSLDNEKIVELSTPNKQCTINIQAIPLPAETVKLLEENVDLLRCIEKTGKQTGHQSCEKTFYDSVQALKSNIAASLKLSPHIELHNVIDNLWSFGPKRIGPNILVNNIKGYNREIFWPQDSDKKEGHLDPSLFGALYDYDSSFVNGFQLATLAGPLCDEPLMGVAFLVHSWTIDRDKTESAVYGPLSGQIVSLSKECCKKAFQAQPHRLMAAMYTCDIQAKAEILGKLYGVLSKRHGRVVKENMLEGSSTFTITAHIPIVESFNFAQEVRKQTSGLAQPQLVFSHWETIDIDPFWVPQTEEEILHFGDKADSDNQARAYMNDLRKRKGLAIDEKIVEFAEKQRTLTKNK